MARVIWSPQALADLEAIGDYLAREAPAYAQAFVDGAFDAVKQLELFPRSGRAVPEIRDVALREVIYRGYRIFHIVSERDTGIEVDILSVFHSTRQFGAE
ncbi:MAG: type II toxin-antitoxin system RelE/ParE family toxin [Bacteroidota bacterium]